MAIKKKKSGGGGANWMDTYGDMVTLLLCFFVLLYSMSTIDQEKWMIIVQSFNETAIVSTDDSPRGPDGDSNEQLGNDMPMTSDIEHTMEEMMEFLEEMAANNQDSVSYSTGDGYVFIAFNDAVFFGGDSFVLRPAGQEVLLGLVPYLEESKPFLDQVVVTGHTATAQGEYNASKDWRLSSDRASEVVAFLHENTTINPARFEARGNGQWKPVADNQEEAERTKNRRVELMISFSDTALDSPSAGSIDEYYTTTNQNNPSLTTAAE